MAYKPTPKTSYGDTDFSDDTWSPSQGSGLGGQSGGGGMPIQQPPAYYGAPPQPPPPGHYPPQAAGQMPYSGGAQQYGGPMQQGQTGQPQNPIAAMAASLTQEDILFMRQWQRDSFYYRVIPFTAASLGSLYMYNKTKGIPHSIPKYMGMGFLAFVFGKWTYRHEFKRRLAESPSQTPYMQTLRRSLHVIPVSSEFASADSAYGGGLDQWSGGSGDVGNSGFQPSTAFTPDDRYLGSSGGFPQSPSASYGSGLSTSDRLDNQQQQQQNNDDTASGKPRVTYDELRARNRGFIK